MLEGLAELREFIEMTCVFSTTCGSLEFGKDVRKVAGPHETNH